MPYYFRLRLEAARPPLPPPPPPLPLSPLYSISLSLLPASSVRRLPPRVPTSLLVLSSGLEWARRLLGVGVSARPRRGRLRVRDSEFIFSYGQYQ